MSQTNNTVVLSEDAVQIERIRLPWGDVARLMFQFGLLAIPVGIIVSIIATASSMLLFGLMGLG